MINRIVRWFSDNARKSEIAALKKQLAELERSHAVEVELLRARLAERDAQLIGYGRRSVDAMSEISRRDQRIAELEAARAELFRITGTETAGALSGAVYGMVASRKQLDSLHTVCEQLRAENHSLLCQLRSVALHSLRDVNMLMIAHETQKEPPHTGNA